MRRPARMQATSTRIRLPDGNRNHYRWPIECNPSLISVRERCFAGSGRLLGAGVRSDVESGAQPAPDVGAGAHIDGPCGADAVSDGPAHGGGHRHGHRSAGGYGYAEP